MKKHKWIIISTIYFVLILILAFPFRFYETVGRFPNPDGDIREEKIPTSYHPLSSTLFSEITGIQLIPMRQKLCLKNNNIFSLNGEIVSREVLLDRKEGGAMGFKINYKDSSLTEEFYAAPGNVDCKILNSNYEFATTTNTVNIRYLLPALSPYIENNEIKITTASTSEIDFTKSKIYKMVDFSPEIYIHNVILIIFGSLFVISSFIQIIEFIRKDRISEE
jgi:hypothetical protein